MTALMELKPFVAGDAIKADSVFPGLSTVATIKRLMSIQDQNHLSVHFFIQKQ